MHFFGPEFQREDIKLYGDPNRSVELEMRVFVIVVAFVGSWNGSSPRHPFRKIFPVAIFERDTRLNEQRPRNEKQPARPIVAQAVSSYSDS